MRQSHAALCSLLALQHGLSPSHAQVITNNVAVEPLPVPAAPAAKLDSEVRVVVDIRLNGQARGTHLTIRRNDQFHLPLTLILDWGLRKPNAPPTFDLTGSSYYSLTASQLELIRFDARNSLLELSAPASAFDPNSITLPGEELRLSPRAWSVFFNYDVLGTSLKRQVETLDGTFELVGSSPYGSLSYSFIQRGIIAKSNAIRGHERLLTTYRYDWPGKPATLEIGDSVVRPGSFGTALRFGGVGLYTNYELRPGFITQSLPTFAGEVALASTVDVFINDQLRSSSNVPPGPFSINEVPVVTGAGEARLVVRDALGREQVIRSSFYSAGQLLRPGLSQYALAAGWLRQASANSTPNYGNLYGSALWRHGVNKRLTVEMRAESEQQVSSSLGGAATIGLSIGEIELGMIANFSNGHTRGSASLGYNYQSASQRGVTLRWVETENGFRPAGSTDTRSTVQRQVVASAWHGLWSGAALGGSWIEQSRGDGSKQRSLSLNLSWNPTAKLFMNFTASRLELAGRSSNLFRAALSIPVDSKLSANLTAQGGTSVQYNLGLQHTPATEGLGYRISASDGSGGRNLDAAVYADLPLVRLGAQLSHLENSGTAARANLAGSLGSVGGYPIAAREIRDSVILVRAPDLPDTAIFLNNQLAGRTDANGTLILPRVASLVETRIGVDVNSLPTDVSVSTEQLRVVPQFRSATYADLKVRRVASALLRLTLPSGEPLPTGALVQPLQPGAIATRVSPRSEAFLQAQPGPQRVIITYGELRCTVDFELSATPAGTAYQTLGPLPCLIENR